MLPPLFEGLKSALDELKTGHAGLVDDVIKIYLSQNA